METIAPLPSTAHALARALWPDPFYQSIAVAFAHDEAARLEVLTQYFAYSISEAQRTGRCVLAPDPAQGASAWLLPRSPQTEALESASKAQFLRQLLGEQGSANYHRIVDFMTPRAERHLDDGAWYLSIVGIHPDLQGRGLGERLLRPTLDEVDRLGKQAYLETFTPRNIGFYRRLGFVPVARYNEPTTGADYTILSRAAEQGR